MAQFRIICNDCESEDITIGRTYVRNFAHVEDEVWMLLQCKACGNKVEY